MLMPLAIPADQTIDLKGLPERIRLLSMGRAKATAGAVLGKRVSI
jgi:hypothetical protein